MRKKNLFILLIVGLFFVFNACNADEIDTESPDISIISPEDDEHFHPGEKIHFEAIFSDDLELNQFKIDIHYGGDHTHKSTFSDVAEWSYDLIGDLTGKEQHVKLDLEVPENAKHGKYHFMVFCTDMAGNESWIALDIFIEDDDHHDDGH
jgi:hypothetical protein